ncbi:unnamed protein product [Darwinula stevensoni]|uniref:Uncharacterized protein n=1 Tax=Darwinula stevensoni TaxID=69355 RepID=A0A7R8X6E0_9CRUS|nr:unnamed protein product [Darwinula stevensoni]CAG0888060.1 unnamed protein product [Darwinula stevensoni]
MGTFLPNIEERDLEGILLFWEETPPRYMLVMKTKKTALSMKSTRRTVKKRVVARKVKAKENALWISVENMPQIYEDRDPSNVTQISFEGKVAVGFTHHTALILWELDRQLTGLPPLSPNKYELLKEADVRITIDFNLDYRRRFLSCRFLAAMNGEMGRIEFLGKFFNCYSRIFFKCGYLQVIIELNRSAKSTTPSLGYSYDIETVVQCPPPELVYFIT